MEKVKTHVKKIKNLKIDEKKKKATKPLSGKGTEKVAEIVAEKLADSIENKDIELDIDEIFDDLLKAKKEKMAKAKKVDQVKKVQEKEKGRKYTDDGLPIYTEEELDLNNPKAGTTPLCPFECDCCH